MELVYLQSLESIVPILGNVSAKLGIQVWIALIFIAASFIHRGKLVWRILNVVGIARKACASTPTALSRRGHPYFLELFLSHHRVVALPMENSIARHVSVTQGMLETNVNIE